MKPIVYLCQAYSSIDQEEAFRLAVQYTYHLREKGFIVFSPILHTHNYDTVVRRDGFTKEQIEYIKREDYVAWDLALVSAMCNHVNEYGTVTYICPEDGSIKRSRYQERIVMAFAPSCFSIDRTGYDKTKALVWDGVGAKRGYEFAKGKRIKCLLLIPLLEGKEVLL